MERILGRPVYQLPPADLEGKPTRPEGEGKSAEAARRMQAAVTAASERFLAAMDDDFNTAGAVGTLFEMNGAVNRFIEEAHLEGGDESGRERESARSALEWAVGTIRALGGILGLFEKPPTPAAPAEEHEQLADKLIELLVGLRAEARARKDFDQADRIRSRLAELGITLEDRRDGTIWRRAR